MAVHCRVHKSLCHWAVVYMNEIHSPSPNSGRTLAPQYLIVCTYIYVSLVTFFPHVYQRRLFLVSLYVLHSSVSSSSLITVSTIHIRHKLWKSLIVLFSLFCCCFCPFCTSKHPLRAGRDTKYVYGTTGNATSCISGEVKNTEGPQLRLFKEISGRTAITVPVSHMLSQLPAAEPLHVIEFLYKIFIKFIY